MLPVTAATARRFFVERQLLAGPRPSPDGGGIQAVVERLGRVQLDPTSVVARSHLLVLWSRLGAYDTADLDRLMAPGGTLFEHRAYLRPIDQVPLIRAMRRHWPAVEGQTRADMIHRFVSDNAELERHVLVEIERRGPLGSSDLEDRSVASWRSGGYFDGRNVSRMLEFLEGFGRLAVAGRRGNIRLFDLAERVLPADLLCIDLTDDELLRGRLERSARALGVAAGTELRARSRLPGLKAPIEELVAEGLLVRVATDGRERAYVHRDDVDALESLSAGRSADPRSTLLSPFDNLIHDRARTERLFAFRYRMEIYVPPAKREFGYFAMPILHGDRLIGRADLRVDRTSRLLTCLSLHREDGAASDPGEPAAIRDALDDLARFVGAERWAAPASVPRAWAALATRR
jgi:uncharacterized protein YcaQ